MPFLSVENSDRYPGLDEVYAELERRAAGYGNAKRLAGELGVHPTYVRSIKSGNQPMSRQIAEGLGFELRWVKKNEREE